jgi:hypothetical protein
MGINDKPNYGDGDLVRCIRAFGDLVLSDIYLVDLVLQGSDGQWQVYVKDNNQTKTGPWFTNRFAIHAYMYAAGERPIANPTAVSGAAVNNHTCSHCGNDRTSLAELKCWKCGEKLP